jgi:hypothetical protein
MGALMSFASCPRCPEMLVHVDERRDGVRTGRVISKCPACDLGERPIRPKRVLAPAHKSVHVPDRRRDKTSETYHFTCEICREPATSSRRYTRQCGKPDCASEFRRRRQRAQYQPKPAQDRRCEFCEAGYTSARDDARICGARACRAALQRWQVDRYRERHGLPPLTRTGRRQRVSA